MSHLQGGRVFVSVGPEEGGVVMPLKLFCDRCGRLIDGNVRWDRQSDVVVLTVNRESTSDNPINHKHIGHYKICDDCYAALKEFIDKEADVPGVSEEFLTWLHTDPMCECPTCDGTGRV